MCYSSVAQSVEHLTVNQGVTGSSPVRGAISEIYKDALCRILFCVGDFMIDSRIAAMINFVRAGSRVADIGADHGYLAIELAKSGRASFVIATDKNSGPLAAAKKNIAAANLENLIEVRQGDGLKILHAGEVDAICIGGMGGALIAEILENSPEVSGAVGQLILQPMNAVEKILAWLKNNGWLVADVDLAESNGIIYEIISATKNPALVRRETKKNNSPLLKKFLGQRLKKLRRVVNEMSKSPAAASSEKFLDFQKEMNALEKIIG